MNKSRLHQQQGTSAPWKSLCSHAPSASHLPGASEQEAYDCILKYREFAGTSVRLMKQEGQTCMLISPCNKLTTKGMLTESQQANMQG